MVELRECLCIQTCELVISYVMRSMHNSCVSLASNIYTHDLFFLKFL